MNVPKQTVFDTGIPHHLIQSLDAHPCWYIRSLEEVCHHTLVSHQETLKDALGLEGQIVPKLSIGNESQTLTNQQFASFYGMLPILLAVGVQEGFNRLMPPGTEYPIGLTQAVGGMSNKSIFNWFPVCTNNSHFAVISHLLVFALKQELERNLIDTVAPVLLHPQERPLLDICNTPTLLRFLQDWTARNQVDGIAVDWRPSALRFSKLVQAAFDQEPLLNEIQTPEQALSRYTDRQPDSSRLADLIAAAAVPAHASTIALVPESEIKIVPKPEQSAEKRMELHKAKEAKFAAEQSMREAFAQAGAQDSAAFSR